MKRIKTINSHTGLARFLAEVESREDGERVFLAREHTKHIPSPYRYSPSTSVYRWNGKNVVWFETRHKRYEVFEVPASLPLLTAEEA